MMVPITGRKKKHYGSMKRSRAFLIGTVLLAIVLGVNIYANYYAIQKRDILTPVFEHIGFQNNRIIASDALPYTYLGTYTNAVVAVNEAGEEAWRRETAGSVEAIRVDDLRQLVIAGSQGRYIYILNALDGSLIREIRLNGRVYDMDYDSVSQRILVSAPINAAKGQVLLYSAEGDELLRLSGRPARCVRFAPDGLSFYLGDQKANVMHLSLSGELLAQERMDTELYAMDIARDTGDVVVLAHSGTVQRFDADLKQQFSRKLVGDGRAVGVSQDGALIGVGTREGDVYLLDREGNILHSMRLKDNITQIVLNGDKSFVVPWSTALYSLDISAAQDFEFFTRLYTWTYRGMFVLGALFILSLICTFGRSRSAFISFFVALRRHRVAYLLLLPSFALIIVFNYLPVGQAFFYAFTDWNHTTTSMRDVNFVGFANFEKMISEGFFLLGVKNMLLILTFNFIKLLVPLFVAELVFGMSGGRRRYWFRFLLVLPMVVPGVISTLMWKNIYDPMIGLINQVLGAIGRLDLQRPWLGSETTAIWAIIFMGFPWINSFAFLVFYGGLINIPHDLFEAAQMDGSSPVWNLTRIHLPLITPQIKMVVILTFIGSIQDYGQVLLLTEGGPGYATYVPGFELYMNATRLGQYGYACALGLVMFLVILAGTVLNLRMRTEEALG